MLVATVRGDVVAGVEAERARRVQQGLDALTPDDEQRLCGSLARQALREARGAQLAAGQELPEPEADEIIIRAVTNSLFGLGPLQEMLDDQRLIEVNINGADTVWAIFDDGTKALAPPVFPSDDALVSWVQAQAMYGGLSSRPWDPANPIVEFELPGGHRLVGVQSACQRPVVSIRLRRRHDVTLAQLHALHDFDETLMEFMKACVAARMNLIISGETGSGKTTLMRALIAEIPPKERIVVVEHFPELGVDEHPDRHPDVVSLEERVANSEGVGQVSLTSLVRTSRRLDPDRIIVGECVGEEVVDMLDALSQGNTGGMTTIHARSARAVPARVATYAQRLGMTMGAALQLCSIAVDFVIHMSKVREADGSEHRVVSSVVEVVGFDGEQVLSSEVFARPAGGGLAVPSAAISDERTAALAAVGWHASRAADVLSLNGYAASPHAGSIQ